MKPVAASGGSIFANFDVLDDGEDAAGRTGARLLNLAIVALGLGVIGALAFAWSNADLRLRFERQSAATAPKSARRAEAPQEIRAATGRARRAEERRQGAHGNAASGGAYHRGDEGGRGGLATPCSAPVLVLEPGDIGFGKATAIGPCRATVPTPLTGNEQHHEQVTISQPGRDR